MPAAKKFCRPSASQRSVPSGVRNEEIVRRVMCRRNARGRRLVYGVPCTCESNAGALPLSLAAKAVGSIFHLMTLIWDPRASALLPFHEFPFFSNSLSNSFIAVFRIWAFALFRRRARLGLGLSGIAINIAILQVDLDLDMCLELFTGRSPSNAVVGLNHLAHLWALEA